MLLCHSPFLRNLFASPTIYPDPRRWCRARRPRKRRSETPMNGPGRFRFRTWQIVLLLVATVIVAGAAYSTRGKDVDVEVTSPTYQNLESTVATGGTVVPLDEFPARANFAGIVTDIHVRLGQKVRAGQLLLTMKDQYAQARVENARSALAAA